MDAFHTALLEGCFYETDNVLKNDQGRTVESLLSPLVGQDIHLAIHFVPQLPIDPSKWGGGCCLWQPSPCPAGHHEHPDRLLNVAVRGRLGREGNRWWVDQMNGKRVDIPLHLLVGHYGRVAAATVFDVQQIRESLEGFSPDQVESLGVQASDLRDVLSRLQTHLKRG